MHWGPRKNYLGSKQKGPRGEIVRPSAGKGFKGGVGPPGRLRREKGKEFYHQEFSITEMLHWRGKRTNGSRHLVFGDLRKGNTPNEMPVNNCLSSELKGKDEATSR